MVANQIQIYRQQVTIPLMTKRLKKRRTREIYLIVRKRLKMRGWG